MKKTERLLIILMLALFFMLLLSINVYAEDASFSLDKETLDVVINGSGYISYTGGTGTITWTSSDPTIATVDESGIIRGLKVGTTTITATRGSETDICEINVIYSSIEIGGNYSEHLSYTAGVSLVLEEHPSENLYAKVKDDISNEVSNAQVTWTSSDSSIVTINNTGTITAVKSGTAKITASTAGVTDTCTVTVYNAPSYTNFKQATYEMNLASYTDTLKISGIKPKDEDSYYAIITSTNSKPSIVTDSYGIFDSTNTKNSEYFLVNTDENYIYTRNLSKYTELNQDLYLWIVQDVKLENSYCDENGKLISHATKFVVEGKKLTRSKLPPLNLILQDFSVYGGKSSSGENKATYINFNFPTDTENRKFTLKIGRVTDNSILSKIQKKDYTGITELLTYAKNNNSIYSKTLTTTSEAYFRSDKALFDGRSLLTKNAYYYIYVEFDDEDGKYYPIEGVTLAQAWFSSLSSSWDLLGYTSSDFKWDNLTPTPSKPTKPTNPTPTAKPTIDTTTAKGTLPQTGVTLVVLAISILVAIAGAVVGIIKYRKYNIKY